MMHDLHVVERGRGPSVVLLHGTPSSPDDFDPLVAVLAPRHRVLVPHMPGYGRSPPSDASLDVVIERLEEQLLRAGVEDVAIVAFSGGAYKAAAIALRRKLAVRRLALVAPNLGLDPPVAQAYREIAAAGRAGTLDPRPTWLDRMASPGLASRDAAGAQRVLAWLDAAPMSVVCDELEALANAPDLRRRAPELGCPVLVVSGTLDGAVPFAGSKTLASSIPSASLEAIEGAGHALLVEAPDRVLGVLRTFLEGS